MLVPPGHILLFPVILQIGATRVSTFWVQVAVHPFELVTLTLYVPNEVTEMQEVVAPVDHK